MNTNHNLKRMAINLLSFIAILAIAFPVTGSAYAQEPVPWLIAFPENDAVEGWEWPEGATVYLTINNAPEGFIREGTAEVTSWGDPRTYVHFDFAGEDGYDLQAGDVVTLTDEFGTTATHSVQNLSVTDVNGDTDTVSGTADIGTTVQVWPHEYDRDYTIEYLVEDGTWVADFGELGFHTIEETGGRAQIVVDSNATAVNWQFTNPHFTVFPDWEFFDGLDWPDGATVTITVAGKPECTTSKESWDGFFNGNFGDGCNIEYGDEVTFTDGITTRIHNVRTLYVTDVNVADNTVSGKAEVEAGTIVYVWPHDGWFEALQATVDGSGNWQVNLDDAGYSIRDDSEGRAEILDEMGNATAEDWHVLHPHFTVFPEWKFFDGLDWPNGATVTITVEGMDACETTKESWGYFFNGNFGEGCDIEVGNVVTFTDGKTTRAHTVQNLAITKVNQEDDTVKGIAGARAEVYVWPHATGEQKMVVASAKGKWDVSFEGIYDLKPGDEGRAQVQDEMGNATAVDWRVPRPRIVASITEDWFYVYDFIPDTALNFTIYTAQNGKPIWKGTVTTDDYGFAWIDAEDRWDLEPGNYLVVKDGSNTKALLIEGFTFDVFNTSYGLLSGTAPEPFGRDVWVGIGFVDQDGWAMNVSTDGAGAWFADFGQPVPSYDWVAAQIFDEDGDASELRPSVVIDWALVIANQEDWVDSGISVSNGQSFMVEALGLMNPCADTYPNGPDFCIFYTPLGAEWEVPYENEFGPFPGPGLPFMALLGRIDGGEPFYVGAGGTFTAEQDGTLWFTPNDNLRTDNQGAYSVQVLLEP